MSPSTSRGGVHSYIQSDLAITDSVILETLLYRMLRKVPSSQSHLAITDKLKFFGGFYNGGSLRTAVSLITKERGLLLVSIFND